MSFWICATCAVEHAEQPDVCAICADERQYVPVGGQRWTTLDEQVAAGYRVRVHEVEPGLYGVRSEPEAGIGQQALLVVTDGGNLLWDPLGFVDDAAARQVLEFGEVAAIIASHPHMYGVQVEWSRRLGGVPVYISEADAQWVARPDAQLKTWSGTLQPVPGVTVVQPGGHFPGSAVAHWTGADGKGVLLAGDTIGPNPDGSVTFMRSFPNRIPLSGAVALRIAKQLEDFDYDRLYGNFGGLIRTDAGASVQRSAERYAAWTRGDYDHLT